MHASTRTAKEIQAHLAQAMSLLNTLRDEIRVELHLAGLEAQAQWSSLESRYEHAVRRSDTLSHDSQAYLLQTIEAFQGFLVKLQDKNSNSSV